MTDLDSRVSCDLLLTGGRVIDPESGRDGVSAVGISDGKIVHIGDPDVTATETIDVSGLVVAPGFIDMHSHAQSVSGLRLQALDGVTTSLELESGAVPVKEYYAWAESEGRPINFGYSAGWVLSRMHILDGAPVIRPQNDENYRIPINMFEHNQNGPRWRGPADDREVHEILDFVHAEVEQGAIGIGVLAGYAPTSGIDEFNALAALAAQVNQPLFVHARSMAAIEPNSALDAVKEIITASEANMAPIHLCHMNSTSGQFTREITKTFLDAQRRGTRLTTEAYPFSAGSTVIGAAFLAPDQLHRNHLEPKSLTYLATGERVADKDRLREIRGTDPGGLCVIEFFDESDPEQLDLLMLALTFPEAAIASDAMPMTFFGSESQRAEGEKALRDHTWPLPESLVAHPRSSGCFAKALSWLVREQGALDLVEAIRRCTLLPASILAEAAPAMRSKGRLQVGADADVTVFDPDTVAPQGDYLSLRPSVGFKHVVVGGVPVVSNGDLQVGVLPGKAIRGSAVTHTR